MGGFLAHHSIEGFLTNVDQVRAVDETDEEWTAFLAGWWDKHRDTPVLANELLASTQPTVTEDDPWHGAFITGRNGRLPNTKSLGWMLRGQTGRWHGEYVLRTAPGGRAGDRRTWHVEHTTTRNEQDGRQDEDDQHDGQQDGGQEELFTEDEPFTNGWPVGSIGAEEAQAYHRTHP